MRSIEGPFAEKSFAGIDSNVERRECSSSSNVACFKGEKGAECVDVAEFTDAEELNGSKEEVNDLGDWQ